MNSFRNIVLKEVSIKQMIAYMFKKASEAINMKHLFFSHKCGPEWKVIEYIVISE